jgi:NhaP-type Na+/H+ or K+/H+ antiporter
MSAEITESYFLLLTIIGAVVLAMAALPRMTQQLPLSVPMILVTVGAGIGLIGGAAAIPGLHESPEVSERVTEFLVIVSLMGAGLKLDTRFDLRRWAITWRLLGIAMPLSILGIALVGWTMLGLPAATALLLAAVLAPTDPVLASDVQVGKPGHGDGPRVRFALTSEAGLNDGLAFPFVHLAIAWTVHESFGAGWIAEWFAIKVCWKILAGVAVGFVLGRLAAWLLFRLPPGTSLAETKDGFVVVGLTILSYGVTELVQGYGFLGVFVAALTLRSVERSHEFHAHLHNFAEEIERLTIAVLLLLLGASFASQFLPYVTGNMLLAALLILLVIRPLSGLVSLIGERDPLADRCAVAFFGIRGMGSFYYLAYALTETTFEEAGTVWTTVVLVVVLSILIHGASVTPVMRGIERRLAREERARRTDDPAALDPGKEAAPA